MAPSATMQSNMACGILCSTLSHNCKLIRKSRLARGITRRKLNMINMLFMHDMTFIEYLASYCPDLYY